MPAFFFVTVLLALPGLAGPAFAQIRQCQPACLQEARRSGERDPANACAIRCAAADAFLRQERSRPEQPVRMPAPDPTVFGIILAGPDRAAGFGLP